MAEKKKNLSEFTPFKINSANHIRIGIVVSEWNDHITDSLLKGARETLIEQGVAPEHILVEYVPGSYELPSGADMVMTHCPDVDAVIVGRGARHLQRADHPGYAAGRGARRRQARQQGRGRRHQLPQDAGPPPIIVQPKSLML